MFKWKCSPCRKLRWYEPVVEKFCCVGAGVAGAVRGYGPSQGKEARAQEIAGFECESPGKRELEAARYRAVRQGHACAEEGSLRRGAPGPADHAQHLSGLGIQ